MRNSILIVFTAALLPVVAGFAAAAELLGEDPETLTKPLVEQLAKRSDADSQAAAGLLSAFYNREQSLRLLAQASHTAPERADLLWLHIQSCQSDTSCDPVPMERRLRDLDKQNGSGWFGVLARAKKDNDEEAMSAALVAIGRSRRVDTYWTTLIARLSRKVASTNTGSLTDAEVQIIGVLAATAIPAYTALHNACKGERLTRDDVLEACRGIADSLLNGDTLITESIGITIAQQVWPENSAKWQEAAELRRLRDYRRQFASKVDTWLLAHPVEYLDLCEKYRREQDVDRAVLMAIGVNPNTSFP